MILIRRTKTQVMNVMRWRGENIVRDMRIKMVSGVNGGGGGSDVT